MEHLKKTIFATTLVIVLSNTIYAQDGALQDAFNNAASLEYKGEYLKAAEAIKKGYDEKSYEANLRAGWLHYEAALYIESENYYKKAIALIPNSIEAKFGYTYPALALGNLDLAIAQYNAILKIDPQNTTAGYRLGLIYYNKKDFQSAYKCFDKVVSLFPFGYDALLMFAWSNYQIGKNKEAKAVFKKVLLISPGSQSALEGLGLIK